MQMLYNSDSFAVLQIEFGLSDGEVDAAGGKPRWLGDRRQVCAPKASSSKGTVAQSFKDGVQALIEGGSPSQEVA